MSGYRSNMRQLDRAVLRCVPGISNVLMVAGSAAYYPWRHFGSWPAYVILWGAIGAALWHLALIIAERDKIGFIIYAFVNLSLYIVFGIVCLMLVTGDFL
jgi:hypothetical protein